MSDVQKPTDAPEKRMTITAHLVELKKRIVRSVIVYLLAAVACFVVIEPVVEALIAKASQFQFIYVSPSELLTSYLKLALIAGLVISAPFIVLQLWGFVREGLKASERKVVFFTLLGGLVFFAGGAAFAYFIALPFMIEFLAGFNSIEAIRPMISFANYSGFVISTLLTFGLVFEMPIVAALLSFLGILKPQLLVKSRRYMIVIIAVVAAIITPPDVASQVMIGIPMYVLFEVSVVISKVIYAAKQRKIEQDDAALEY